MVSFCTCFGTGGVPPPSSASEDLSPRSSQASFSGPQIRILALGDSITAGYYNRGFRFAPYAVRLYELAFEHGLHDFEVVKEGVCGECVVTSMVLRADDLLEDGSHCSRRYTHVFVQGGINDLASGAEAGEVFAGLQRIYEAGLQHGARVVAMTLYGFREASLAMGRAHKELLELNTMIRAYVKERSKVEAISLVDLETALAPMRLETCTPFWDDLVHLTPTGYAYMADLLWDSAIRPVLGCAGTL